VVFTKNEYADAPVLGGKGVFNVERFLGGHANKPDGLPTSLQAQQQQEVMINRIQAA
jgi:hypothetical protein